MAWTTKPTGTITLKSTGLAATLTKAWVIDTGSGLTFTEYYSSGNDLVMPASAVTWNSAPTTADIGQYDSTSWIDMSDLEGTLVFVFTPLNWDYTAADFKLMSKSVAGQTIRIEWLHFATTHRRWNATLVTNFGVQADINPGASFTSNEELNKHTVVGLAYRSDEVYSANNGTYFVNARKDVPETRTGTGGIWDLSNGVDEAITGTQGVFDDGGVGGEIIRLEGIFYWDTRLDDADLDTVVADTWGELAEVGGATTSDVNLHGTGRGISRGVARGIG